MSTTLTNGLKLPDKGSVDWYADMQNNYTILDGAVGTVAEHTTQIAGKAPAVHTHTKADITDFPAYGNSAGTICEGNDSRLSDARTPVAHTHVTADVTDLLNSAHTWTGDNTYSKPVVVERNTDTGNFLALRNSVAELGSTPASATPVTIAYRDKNDNNLGYMGIYYDTDGSNTFRLSVRNKYTSGAPSTSGTVDYTTFQLKLNADNSKEGILRASFRPYENSTYDLGSSSYQWNNLYAKNYYYNGVAWGLDKENVWSGSNRFTKGIGLGSITSYTDCSLGFTSLYNVLFFNTRGSSNITSYGTYVFYGYSNVSPDRGAIIRMVRTTDRRGETNDGYIPDTSFDLYRISPEKLFINFMEAVRVINNGTENSLKPITDNTTDLGTSDKRFKTFNGVNPGALSLPDCQVTQSIDRTGWVYDGATYNTVLLATTDINMTKNGWLYVRMASTTSSDKLSIKYNSTGDRFPTSTFGDTGGYIEVFVPVVANTNIFLLATKDLSFCKFYPCLGNVPSGV